MVRFPLNVSLCAESDCGLAPLCYRFCRPCLDANPARLITMKPPARKSARKKTQRDYAGLNAGQETDPNRWLRMMEGKTIKKDPFRRMKGSEVGIEWLENDENAMKEPIVIESVEGLGMKMPPSEFTVDDVAESLGEDHPVEVIGTFYTSAWGLLPVCAIMQVTTPIIGCVQSSRRCNTVQHPTLDSWKVG